MKSLFLKNEETYTGEQLRSLWAYRTHDVQGDSIVAFIGPCDVRTNLICDMADAKADATIRAARMLHFIVEHFDIDLTKTILRQRLLMAIVKDEVNRRLGRETVQRKADDLYDGDRKLTVSIATASPVSTLIHAGVNVDPAGAPVPAVGLAEYGMEPRDLSNAILRAYLAEMDSITDARTKVKGVQ
ncbi:MAG: DUF366 family protein [Planctomycetes bacterium]|nr:DUF366 family protein [Planctomycetota bacterium]